MTDTAATVGDATTAPAFGASAKALFAPLTGLVRLRAAARSAANSHPALGILLLALGGLAWAALVVFLVLWDDTVLAQYVATQVPGPVAVPAGETVLQVRTLSEAWTAWHASGSVGPTEQAALMLSLFIVLALGAVAWLQLPVVHAGGSLANSAYRALGAGVATLGWLCLVTLVAGATMVICGDVSDRARASGVPWPSMWLEAVPFIVIFALIDLYLMLAGVAARAVIVPAPDPRPRCEQCGYDLTHVPESGRCSECDYAVQLSLTPGLRRPGCAWERAASARAWFATLRDVLVNPRAFYASLRLRSDPAGADAFARRTFAAIGCCAAVWMLLATATLHPSAEAYLLLPSLFLFLTPLCGWVTHRGTAVLVCTWWFVRGLLPEPAYARRVLGYETAFLWTFCAFNGAVISSIFAWEDWLTSIFGYVFGGMPVEVLLLAVGNGSLILLWLARSHRALSAVRWANF